MPQIQKRFDALRVIPISLLKQFRYGLEDELLTSHDFGRCIPITSKFRAMKLVWSGHHGVRPSGSPILSSLSVAQQAKHALATGDHMRARKLVNGALEQFPNDEQLKRLSRLLAPPRLIGVHRESTNSGMQEANRRWLREHSDEYQNKWVAIQDGILLGASTSLSELRNEVPL